MSLVTVRLQWPGGISTSIRCHDEHVDYDDFDRVTRAWRRFVRDQWIPRTEEIHDPEYETQQRQTLVERWATAEQSFRDAYERKASEHDEPAFEFDNHEPCCQGPGTHVGGILINISAMTPEKQALLLKCIILMFHWEVGGLSDEFIPQEVYLLAQDQDSCLPSFQLTQSVACPNFLAMHMALDGTLLFLYPDPVLIIDDYTLETGLAGWVDFKTNLAPLQVYRKQIVHDQFTINLLCVHENGDFLETVLDYMVWDAEEKGEPDDHEAVVSDEAVNMRLPLADLYFDFNEQNGSIRLAPGYLGAEAAGNGLAMGYDLSRVLVDGKPFEIRE
ncbi:hypothetical protein BO78DRAFT_356997 [Aspergillus sclerotiicarbonarius CBS 121057]|uniref:Uncharacterized protein n=1 Tax=Aspergillus sclerotiicarbonarius (strain CBS 121057 / IBT 28362) TaxID=1448318 RepID=A0A319ER27_ASPSB|nr:hypothetical protein BO78DRAFT_356997 [Aspergillus sclerotiicarbonarius CBS 121057]